MSLHIQGVAIRAGVEVAASHWPVSLRNDINHAVNGRYVTYFAIVCLPRYVTRMALTNAERQARFRARKQKQSGECVTTEEIRRAARLMYDHFASLPENRALPWDEYLAECRTRRGRGRWRDLLPDDPDPEVYDEFPPEDAALLVKVATLMRVVNFPPDEP